MTPRTERLWSTSSNGSATMRRMRPSKPQSRRLSSNCGVARQEAGTVEALPPNKALKLTKRPHVVRSANTTDTKWWAAVRASRATRDDTGGGARFTLL